MKERSLNVYENKGPLWKKWERSLNVYENKGSYTHRGSMSLKINNLTKTPEHFSPVSARPTGGAPAILLRASAAPAVP
jgi:hypothetical protein